MKPAAGTLVTRNVKLVRPLGRGGMGSVWVGEHTSLETEVAVKFISPEHAEKKRFVARFRREASSAAKIKSPHVVQIFDHGVTEEGTPYIVMELLHGEPLSRRLKRGPLTPREAAMLVAQVCKVLTLAHGLGIVHRDLKPDNLFLVESGYELFVKVLDFGIAKQLAGELSEITDTGAMVGTPYYMSPEMLLSPKAADHRADLWALSVVAYHALTGVLPFRGETLAALSVAINDGHFKPPSSIANSLDAEIDVWFKLALCRNIEGRFSSAEELAQGFRQALMDSNELSGDRTSQPLARDSLPDTARPSGAEALSAIEAAPTVQTPATGDNTEPDDSRPRPAAPDTADRTVTSEQLAEIRSDRGVDVDADTYGATESSPSDASADVEQSTLEGTASSGAQPSSPWGRLAGVAALVGVGVVAFAVTRGDTPPKDPTGAARSSAVTAAPSPARELHPIADPRPAASPAELPPSGEVPAEEVAATSSASASARVATAPPPPLRVPTKAPAPAGKSKDKCANPFIVDENGDLQPRPGCF